MQRAGGRKTPAESAAPWEFLVPTDMRPGKATCGETRTGRERPWRVGERAEVRAARPGLCTGGCEITRGTFLLLREPGG